MSVHEKQFGLIARIYKSFSSSRNSAENNFVLGKYMENGFVDENSFEIDLFESATQRFHFRW